jgi:DNA polymerase-3 subunit epsilon
VRLEIETNGESRLVVGRRGRLCPGAGPFGELSDGTGVTDGTAWARTVLDAGTTENILAEFHQRSDRWRFRAVGQGYEEQLAGFAARHGVDIA